MIVTLQIAPQSVELAARHGKAAAGFGPACGRALVAALNAGGDAMRRFLQEGGSRLTMRHPASGLAASVRGWVTGGAALEGAIGVPENAPAARYARILNTGGRIFPVNAKALAVPLSKEAQRYTSPRDQAGLALVRQKGRPPLLVEWITRRGKLSSMKVHWVLVDHVDIPASGWFDQAVDRALPVIADAFSVILNRWLGAGAAGAVAPQGPPDASGGQSPTAPIGGGKP